MTTLNPKLTLWTRPQCYVGATWPDWYIFLGRNRDSDCLTNSNFEQGLKAVRAVMSKESISDDENEDCATVQVVSENHWACGWVKWIAIHKSDTTALECASGLLDRLDNYPVLNEEDWSEREHEQAGEVWKNCYDAGERVEYIRAHRSQFEFHDLRDMLACVRGRYFAGYASELIQ
jgi:hypothetical protein